MRRKASLPLVAALVVTATLVATPIAAQLPEGEVLYLVDTQTWRPGDSGSYMYRVYLDSATNIARLEPLPGGTLPYPEVEAIAGTPDGTRIYFIDTYRAWVGPSDPLYGTGMMGYYDVATSDVVEIGYVKADGALVPEVVTAAFSPSGELYVGSQLTNGLYLVDSTTGLAFALGRIRVGSAWVDLYGADIAFGADGSLYLWTNQAASGAPAGLYKLTLPAQSGYVAATFVGRGVPSGTHAFFTGLALRANGFGHIAGSSNVTPGNIHEQSKYDSLDVNPTPWTMTLGGQPYIYVYGDMANGRLGGFCTRTIGYWKNHDWPISVTIAGVPVDQAYGQTILDGANAKNFSMLVAQLIAAKLNTGNASGLDFIDAAEQWLAAQGVVLPSGTLDWTKPFATKDQKTTANSLKDALDLFNNENHCE